MNHIKYTLFSLILMSTICLAGCPIDGSVGHTVLSIDNQSKVDLIVEHTGRNDDGYSDWIYTSMVPAENATDFMLAYGDFGANYYPEEVLDTLTLRRADTNAIVLELNPVTRDAWLRTQDGPEHWHERYTLVVTNLNL